MIEWNYTLVLNLYSVSYLLELRLCLQTFLSLLPSFTMTGAESLCWIKQIMRMIMVSPQVLFFMNLRYTEKVQSEKK